MTVVPFRVLAVGALYLAAVSGTVAEANAYREKGKAAKVADSSLAVTPTRDWNRLDAKPGKNVEVWTLDGEQLNDVTFYGGVEPGKSLVKERDKKQNPLPKFTSTTLLTEVPELLERTYRTNRGVGAFTLTGSTPDRFLGRDSVRFTYDYSDSDNLSRRGEARAVLVSGKLYMATFDAPRLHFYDRTLADYRALSDSAKLAE